LLVVKSAPESADTNANFGGFTLEGYTMDNTQDKRAERRLHYNWPIWFAEDYNDSLTQGQMVDISSGGAAFTCYADGCPRTGDHITARFSVPRYAENEAFDMENFMRTGRICRIDELSPFVRRVAVRFGEPLPFKPGEIKDTEALAVNVNEELQNLKQSEARAMAEPLQVQTTTESAGT